MRPLLRALRLLEVPPGRALWAVAAGVLALGSAVTLIGVSAWLIVRAWQMPPVLDLTVAVVAVRALGISRGVFRYLERLASHDVALRGMGTLRAGLYDTLALGNPAAAVRASRGGVLTRTGEDVDTLGDVVVRALLPIAVAVVVSCAAVLAVALVSPVAALILLGALLLGGVVGPWLSARAAQDATEKGAVERQRSTEEALTALDHAAELRVAGRLDGVLRAADEHQRRAVRASDRSAAQVAVAVAATPLALGASVLGALLVGIELHASGAIAPMSLAIISLLPLVAFEATAPLPEAAAQLTRSTIAARRIVGLLDAAGTARPPQARTVSGAGAPTLAARALGYGWPDTTPLGRLEQLVATPGARVAVVGPSGVGKSTLLMTLAGLLGPLAGTVTLDGVDTREVNEDDVRRLVGFFAEDAHLFDTTVRDNLLVARGDATDEQITAVLAKVGLAQWLAGLDEGLGTVLVGGAAAVSGGQRRRLLLARALLSPVPILLLDEPTEHLDAEDSDRLLVALCDRRGELLDPAKTVVVVTHHLPQQAAPDRLIALG